MKQFASEMYSEDQVMMTLSAVAYTSFDSIATLQDNLNEAEVSQTSTWRC